MSKIKPLCHLVSVNKYWLCESIPWGSSGEDSMIQISNKISLNILHDIALTP